MLVSVVDVNVENNMMAITAGITIVLTYKRTCVKKMG